MRPLLRFASVFFLLSQLAGAQSQTIPEPTREFRGAWVPSVSNLEWPSKPGLPTAVQRRELVDLLDAAARLRLNAVILQVRPACDALYPSELEPWSPWLTGAMGQGPSEKWDPLATAILEAHARGLELHAWINPFRALAGAKFNPSAGHISRTHPERVVRYGGNLWLDPGLPANIDLTLRVVEDLLARYDLDGLHIDDYFYPYPVHQNGGIVPFPDERSYAAHRAGGGKLARDDWRRENVNLFVHQLWRTVSESKRPGVKLGISPFGIWRPGVPATTVAQLDAWGHLFADARLWLRNGWCDYFVPQLYWRESPADQSFSVLLAWWQSQNEKKRHVWPGMADDRIGKDRGAEETLRQIQLTRRAQTGGHAHWPLRALRRDAGGIGRRLTAESYPAPALVPAVPWRNPGAGVPPAPQISLYGKTLSWTLPDPRWQSRVRWWAVQARDAKQEWPLVRVLPGTSREITLPEEWKNEAVAVRAVGFYGELSPPGVAGR